MKKRENIKHSTLFRKSQYILAHNVLREQLNNALDIRCNMIPFNGFEKISTNLPLSLLNPDSLSPKTKKISNNYKNLQQFQRTHLALSTMHVIRDAK